MDGSLDNIAGRFINFYGSNGTVSGQNVTNFLDSLSMSAQFRSRISVESQCPRRPDLSSVSWTRANASGLISLVLDGVQTPSCYGTPPQSQSQLPAAESVTHNHPLHVWGYGLLFVTLINLCAVLGVLFTPCMGRRFYKLVMTFMVSLGVGTLLTTGLLVLLPESLELLFIHEEVNKENSTVMEQNSGFSGLGNWRNYLSREPWFLWRCSTVFGGIYMFFVIERLLKELIRWKTGGKSGGGHHGHSHGVPMAGSPHPSAAADVTEEIEIEKPAIRGSKVAPESEDPGSAESTGSGASPDPEMAATNYGSAMVLQGRPSTGCCSGLSQRMAVVQPLAWMILLGDVLHNFIDGLSIGAAFTQSTLSGVSICLAVLCEELPHELGDFAILLSAGMSVRMALVFNCLSACTCYLGFTVGVFLGESGASVWVFAIASGMFLYISLVDMVPEMTQAMDEPDAQQLGKAKIFLLQNLGLFTGFGAVLLLAVYGEKIIME